LVSAEFHSRDSTSGVLLRGLQLRDEMEMAAFGNLVLPQWVATDGGKAELTALVGPSIVICINCKIEIARERARARRSDVDDTGPSWY
jgi:hypothetical protein